MDLVYVISCRDYFMSWHNDIRYIVAALLRRPVLNVLYCLHLTKSFVLLNCLHKHASVYGVNVLCLQSTVFCKLSGISGICMCVFYIFFWTHFRLSLWMAMHLQLNSWSYQNLGVWLKTVPSPVTRKSIYNSIYQSTLCLFQRALCLLVVSSPDPTHAERVWWHPADSLGFIKNS